jgi:hypothetical protein
MSVTLPFPSERPPSYLKYDGEPSFSAEQHLALERPEKVTTLKVMYSQLKNVFSKH